MCVTLLLHVLTCCKMIIKSVKIDSRVASYGDSNFPKHFGGHFVSVSILYVLNYPIFTCKCSMIESVMKRLYAMIYYI